MIIKGREYKKGVHTIGNQQATVVDDHTVIFKPLPEQKEKPKKTKRKTKK